MPLFEVAVLQKPTKKEIEDEGKTDTLLFGPKAVVAKDPMGAIVAALTAEGAPKIDPQKAEVLVRPFA